MTDSKPDIVMVLEHYGFDLPLHRNPHGVKVKCAFHGDRRASAILNEHRQYFACFACDARGDSWALIMRQEGVDFKGAIQFASDMEWSSAEAFGPSGRAAPVEQRRGAPNARSRRRRRRS